MLTGENGILKQANNAKKETEEAKREEENTLIKYEDYINNKVNDTAIVGEIVQNGNKQYSNNGTAIIPEGFMIVPGLDDVSQGLVISDNSADTEEESSNIIAEGNQFVWIPITNEDEYVRNRSYEFVDVSKKAYTDMGYLPDELQPTIPNDITSKEEIGEINEIAEREAVVSKGGFYISRYEAGLEGNEILVSKKGATVWKSKTHDEFKEIGKKFITKNNSKVRSAMCSGIQWDMVMKFVDGKVDGNGTDEFNVCEYNANRHTGKPNQSTGQNESDRVCNIYDLEGNCFEYVAEKTSYSDWNSYVYRGGGYYQNDTRSAAFRYCYNGTDYDTDSFRIVLYII